MRIEDIWLELERESQAGNAAAWLTRFALPRPSQPLLVALEGSENRRALLLPLPKAAIPRRRDWPQCTGLQVFSVVISDQPYLGVRLRDSSSADVFTALAEDVAPRVAATLDPQAAVAALLGRLRRWQKFLTASTAGLSVERQRGLHGELYTLREHLLPRLGAEAAVAAWRAPRSTHQDFQVASGAVEVKTTTAKQPQSVRITSERQLDQAGIPWLFLHVVVLDEREVEGVHDSSGESLPDVVRALRKQLQTTAVAAETFDDRLLDVGYLEVDVPRYENRRFTLRHEHTFRVQRNFPCLVEKNLPSGVGDVSYALSLAACEPFATSIEDMLAKLQEICVPITRAEG
jgi:hypothetical protein